MPEPNEKDSVLKITIDKIIKETEQRVYAECLKIVRNGDNRSKESTMQWMDCCGCVDTIMQKISQACKQMGKGNE